MREFFKSELKTLQVKTGLRQYENISAMPDAEFQFKILFDSMIAVCNEFSYIPDNDKKRIIQEQIIKDQDMTALNSRTIWKWFNANKDHYWAVAQAKKDPIKHTPVDFEALPDKLKQQIEEFKMSLVDSPLKTVPKVTAEELKAIEEEDRSRQEMRKSEAAALRIQREKQVQLQERRREAQKELGLDKVNIGDLKEFWIEGMKILARSEEEAQEYFIRVYAE